MHTIFSIFFPSTNLNFGDLGKDGVRPRLFIYIFSSPNPNFGTFWEKWSWTQLVKYPFVTAFVFGHSMRQ